MFRTTYAAPHTLLSAERAHRQTAVGDAEVSPHLVLGLGASHPREAPRQQRVEDERHPLLGSEASHPQKEGAEVDVAAVCALRESRPAPVHTALVGRGTHTALVSRAETLASL